MKVISNTVKEIHISHLTKTTIENLTKMAAIKEAYLQWCNGILFLWFHFDAEGLVEKKAVNGIWYIDAINYTECKDKINQAKWNGYSIEVLDMTGHTAFESITESIKVVI